VTHPTKKGKGGTAQEGGSIKGVTGVFCDWLRGEKIARLRREGPVHNGRCERRRAFGLGKKSTKIHSVQEENLKGNRSYQ